jgi:hypothetical protein
MIFFLNPGFESAINLFDVPAGSEAKEDGPDSGAICLGGQAVRFRQWPRRSM